MKKNKLARCLVAPKPVSRNVVYLCCQEGPGGARRSQEGPGGTRRGQEEPGGAGRS